MGLAHNTQRLTCRVVLRGCCWLRNTRDSQLARDAAARLLCESGSVATALPLPTNWSVLYSSEYFFALVCPFSRAFFRCCGVKQRSVLGTVAPRVCCLQLVPQRRRPAALRVGAERRFPRSPKAEKPRRYWPKIDFFDFRLAFFSPRRASLGGARFFVFFFFFVLLSEDNHRRSPHVAVGVTRRLTLRKCLHASHVTSFCMHTSHRHRHRPHPRRTPIRTLCLSNPPIARTHVQATPRTTVGRSVRPQNPFFWMMGATPPATRARNTFRQARRRQRISS